MSHIDVYLTTTKWIHLQRIEDARIAALDIPVCAANIAMLMFGGNAHENEEFEHQWSNMCKDMAKVVVVKPEKRFVYIGDNVNATEETGLVEYTSEINSEYTNHFFERWIQVKSMLFEFTVIGRSTEAIFCLKGLWVHDHWQFLEVIPSNKLKVVEPQKE